MVNIPKNSGSGHKAPTPINDDNPTAVAAAFFKVVVQGSSFSSLTTSFFLFYFLLASNIGKGLGLGHNLFP